MLKAAQDPAADESDKTTAEASRNQEDRQIPHKSCGFHQNRRAYDLPDVMRNTAREADTHGRKERKPIQKEHHSKAEHRPRRAVGKDHGITEQPRIQSNAHKAGKYRGLGADTVEGKQGDDMAKPQLDTGNTHREMQDHFHVAENECNRHQNTHQRRCFGGVF